MWLEMTALQIGKGHANRIKVRLFSLNTYFLNVTCSKLVPCISNAYMFSVAGCSDSGCQSPATTRAAQAAPAADQAVVLAALALEAMALHRPADTDQSLQVTATF